MTPQEKAVRCYCCEADKVIAEIEEMRAYLVARGLLDDGQVDNPTDDGVE